MIRTQQLSVYRFFDGEGQLLYVGMTADLPARMRQHAKEKEWWPQVAKTASEIHPTEMAATVAEATAIVVERPRYNIAGAGVDLEQLKSALGLRGRWTARSAAAKAARHAAAAGGKGRFRKFALTAICLAWIMWFAPFAYRFIEWAGVDMPAVVTAGFAATAIVASFAGKPRTAIAAACSLPGIAGQELAAGVLGPVSEAAKGCLSAATTALLVGVLAWLVLVPSARARGARPDGSAG